MRWIQSYPDGSQDLPILYTFIPGSAWLDMGKSPAYFPQAVGWVGIMLMMVADILPVVACLDMLLKRRLVAPIAECDSLGASSK